MKRLTLLRHADAERKESGLSDFVRPLSRRGLREAESIAERLRSLALIPDLLLTSPAERARHTADIVARALSRRPQSDDRLYLASCDALLELVQATDPPLEHLMIVGHNPGLSELARLLAPRGEAPELATASACLITFEGDDWRSVERTSSTSTVITAPI